MKEEKTKSKKGIIYYVVLGICIALLVAATVLTVYFATRKTEPIAEGPTVNDPVGDDPQDTPPQQQEPEDNKPSGGEASGDENQPSGGESVIKYVMPVDSEGYLVEYNSIYANLTAKRWYRHKAVDFNAAAGTDVRAMADGTVSKVSVSKELGNLIVIDHENGLQTYYRFVEPTSMLAEGVKVTAGQKIGAVAEAYGSEAHDGEHLHFEVWLAGKAVDPDSYLDAALGEK